MAVAMAMTIMAAIPGDAIAQGPRRCTDAPYGQLDFWVGEWDGCGPVVRHGPRLQSAATPSSSPVLPKISLWALRRSALMRIKPLASSWS